MPRGRPRTREPGTITTRSFELPIDLDEWLKNDARRMKLSVSALLRLLVTSHREVKSLGG